MFGVILSSACTPKQCAIHIEVSFLATNKATSYYLVHEPVMPPEEFCTLESELFLISSAPLILWIIPSSPLELEHYFSIKCNKLLPYLSNRHILPIYKL